MILYKNENKDVSQSGLEALCGAVFEQARRDYFSYRKMLETDRRFVREKKWQEAAAGMEELERSFTTGIMDIYLAFCPNVCAQDIWDGFVKEYEKQKAQTELAV